MPEAEQGMNVARIAACAPACRSSASAVTVNRFCSSGLQAIAYARRADHVRLRRRAIVAGGTESMSLVPMGGNKVAPNPALVDDYPDVYLTTGLVAENHAREARISREEQDAFALASHQRALAAIDAGRFADEIVPLPVTCADAAAATAPPTVRDVDFDAGRRPAARHLARGPGQAAAGVPRRRHVTAGNSSQMSDGAAAVLVVEAERARALGLTPLARFVGYATAGVEPERFGIGPVPAIRKALKLAPV